MKRVIKPLWGWYDVLYEEPGLKIKKLFIEPGKKLSNQRHFKRSEHWFIIEGSLDLTIVYNDISLDHKLNKNSSIDIPVGAWHHPINNGTKPVIVIETQYGKKCIEEDIERI